jgi:hypothetical protein
MPHLGDAEEMETAIQEAARDQATQEAAGRIRRAAFLRAEAVLYSRMRGQRDVLAASFAPAVAEPIAALNDEASALPHWFTPAQAGQLDLTTYGT